MKISVILCTYNRCESLAKALASVSSSAIPKSVEWEVLVVDNNSNDRTREVAEGYCRQFPGRFRYLFEPRQGKSHALNAGIREVHGDVVAFIDDDVTVQPTWLANLTSVLRDGTWAGVGGRILPDRKFSPPRWIPMKDPYPFAPLAIFDPDRDAGPLESAPYGNNMAFQRKMFEKYGGFRTDLGPGVGSGVLLGEDSDFGYRLIMAGERIWYEPTAVVYHAVPMHRLQKRYFLQWWYKKGREEVRMLGVPSNTKWFIGGVPLHMFRRLAIWTMRWAFQFENGQRFGAKLAVWKKAGEIKECHRLSREAK